MIASCHATAKEVPSLESALGAAPPGEARIANRPDSSIKLQRRGGPARIEESADDTSVAVTHSFFVKFVRRVRFLICLDRRSPAPRYGLLEGVRRPGAVSAAQDRPAGSI
jgi:hypothetical protein